MLSSNYESYVSVERVEFVIYNAHLVLWKDIDSFYCSSCIVVKSVLHVLQNFVKSIRIA